MPKRKRTPKPIGPSLVSAHWVDLHVPIPTLRSSNNAGCNRKSDHDHDIPPATLILRPVLSNLYDNGVRVIALTHTIFGRPTANDGAGYAIPDDLVRSVAPSGMTVYKRLHSVVENLPDLAAFQQQSETGEGNNDKQAQDDPLSEYDIVSIAPINVAVLQAACSSARAATVITLDYARPRCPTWKQSDVHALMARNGVIELCYSAACLHRKHRRHFVQACHQLQQASLGLKPRLVTSSGPRVLMDESGGAAPRDAGILALRQPDDIVHLLMTVAGWRKTRAAASMSATAQHALQQSRNIQHGAEQSSSKERVRVHATAFVPEQDGESRIPSEPFHSSVIASRVEVNLPSMKEEGSDTAAEDGFIAF